MGHLNSFQDEKIWEIYEICSICDSDPKKYML